MTEPPPDGTRGAAFEAVPDEDAPAVADRGDFAVASGTEGVAARDGLPGEVEASGRVGFVRLAERALERFESPGESEPLPPDGSSTTS